jgi:hypothetical protein
LYTQVSAALQRARDGKLHNDIQLEEHLCFGNNPFSGTVIDPDTFCRYNDGVIQASILRAAESWELNYSRDLNLSNQMYGIFKSIIKSSALPKGEAIHGAQQDEVISLIKHENDRAKLWDLFSGEVGF